MAQMQPVVWSKGLLLGPHHLQAQDRYLEEQLDFRVGALNFSPWGFSGLEVDRDALEDGVFAISSAAGLMPDGLPFAMPEADATPEPKSLAEHWGADQETMLIHLAIPRSRPGERSVSSKSGPAATRWIAEVEMVRDANTGAAEKPVQVGRKNFRIVAEGESLEGMTSLPLAQVRMSETGGIRLEARFVPPLLDFRANDHMVAIVRRLLEILAARSDALARSRRQRNRSLADFGISDVANFWLLYTVNSHLPQIRHLLEDAGGHPARLFSDVLDLAGALTAFSTDVSPADFPAYRHDDLGGSFGVLDEQVRNLLETVVPSTHASLPLEPVGASVWATAIDQDRYFEAPQWYLAFSAGVDDADLVEKAAQLKVSASDRVDMLFRKALPGLPLQHVPQPPSTIPVRLDYQYFALDRSGDDWEAIRQAGNLSVWVPGDIPDPRLELVVVLPRDS